MEGNRLGAELWRSRYMVVAAVGSSVAVALLATATATKVYAATAIVQVGNALPGPSRFDPFTEQQANAGIAKTYATLLNDRSFLDQLRLRIGAAALTTSALEASITPTAVEGTSLLRIDVEATSPARARALATSVANAFVGIVRSGSREREARLQAELRRSIAQLAAETERLERASVGRESSPEVRERLASLRGARVALTEQLGQLVASAIEEVGNVYVTAPPTAYSTPIRPRRTLNLLAGFLAGAVTGVGLAWLRAVLDRRLRSSEEAESLLKAPLVAAIPLRNLLRTEDPAVEEAYDVLRANLAFLSVERQLQVVTFTSYSVGEGKSSVVEGFAWAASRAGMDVLVVDGDLRTRTLSKRLGYDGEGGLTSILQGLAYSDAVVELAPSVMFLPAGHSQQKPSSLLSGRTMSDLVTELRKNYQLIVLDSPPVAALADAPILASLSDGFILVSRIDMTKRADLRAAASKLRHSGAPIVGVVTLEPQADPHPVYLHPSSEPLRVPAVAGTVARRPTNRDVRSPGNLRWIPPKGTSQIAVVDAPVATPEAP